MWKQSLTYVRVNLVFHKNIFQWLSQPFTLMMPCKNLHCQMISQKLPMTIDVREQGWYTTILIARQSPGIKDESKIGFICLKHWSTQNPILVFDKQRWTSWKIGHYQSLYDHWLEAEINCVRKPCYPSPTMELSMRVSISKGRTVRYEGMRYEWANIGASNDTIKVLKNSSPLPGQGISKLTGLLVPHPIPYWSWKYHISVMGIRYWTSWYQVPRYWYWKKVTIPVCYCN